MAKSRMEVLREVHQLHAEWQERTTKMETMYRELRREGKKEAAATARHPFTLIASEAMHVAIALHRMAEPRIVPPTPEDYSMTRPKNTRVRRQNK